MEREHTLQKMMLVGTNCPSVLASSSNWHLRGFGPLLLFPSVFTCQAIRRTAVIQSTRKRNRNKDRPESDIYNVSFFGTARAGLYA